MLTQSPWQTLGKLFGFHWTVDRFGFADCGRQNTCRTSVYNYQKSCRSLCLESQIINIKLKKNIKIFRSSSKVLGLGLADRWEVPTLCQISKQPCLKSGKSSQIQAQSGKSPKVFTVTDCCIMYRYIVEGVPLSSQLIQPAPSRCLHLGMSTNEYQKKTDKWIVCCLKFASEFLISCKVESFM